MYACMHYERERHAATAKQGNYYSMYLYIFASTYMCSFYPNTHRFVLPFFHTFIIQFVIFMAFQFMFYDCLFAVFGVQLVKPPVSILNNMLQTFS